MINQVTIQEQLNSNMMSMSAYALLQRAIPDLRDGFKPVNRRIITSMNINKTTNFTKSATVEGRVMQLHPHGGSYGSIVGLVQKDKQLIPYLIGKGSWGQYTSKDHTAAAARYTEVKLGKNALEITKELKDKSVKLIPNYDGTQMIPEVLPVTYPAILTQSQDGMAIGFASSIFAYNLLELRDVIQDYYNGKEIKTLYPDLPTGGNIIKDDEAAEEIMRDGKGSLKIRAKIRLEDDRRLVVYELPYGVKRESVIDKIVELNRSGKMKEVTDVRDGTSFKGMKIVIKIRKNADPKEVIAKLYQLTPLEASISANMNVLFEGYPVVMGTRKIIIEWIKWRETIIKTSLNNKLNIMKKDLHLVEGFSKIFKHLDRVIEIIRFEKEEELEKTLAKEFGLAEDQASFISSMQLRSLNENRLNKKIEEIENKKLEIAKLENDLQDDKYIENQLLHRMNDTIKEIEAQPRKSSVSEISQSAIKIVKKVKEELLRVEDYETIISTTKNGFIFKTDKNGKMLSQLILGDEVVNQFEINNSAQLAVLLPDVTIGRLNVSDISLEDGLFVPGLYGHNSYINIIAPIEDAPHVLLGFEDGQLSRIPVESFINSRTVTKNGFYNGAKLIFSEQIPSDYDGEIKIKFGKKEKVVSLKDSNVKNSRVSRGQRFIPKTDEKVSYKLI